MDILEYLENIGVSLKRCGNNEYMGACPFCGGDDRFRVWIDEGQENLGRWACRKGEGKHPGFTASKEFAYTGDLAGLVMELENVSYQEAKKILGLDNFSPIRGTRYQAKQESPFSEEKPKNETWINQARKFVDEKAANLLNDKSDLWEGGSCLEWLRSKRFLTLETIKKFRLGLVTKFESQSVSLWGLEPYTDNKTGETVDKLSFYRQNLIIPTWRRGGYIDRIKVRFPKASDKGQRYTTIRGSNDSIAVYNKPSNVYVVVESELDAILLAQECPQVCPISLGGAGKHPTKALAEEIKKADVLLLCLDSDETGAEKLAYWLDNFKNASPLRIPADLGLKDLTELQARFIKGESQIDLATFIAIGIEDFKESAKEEKKENLAAGSEATPKIKESLEEIAEIIDRESEILKRAIGIADSLNKIEQDYLTSLLEEVDQAEKEKNGYRLFLTLKELEELADKKEIKQ